MAVYNIQIVGNRKIEAIKEKRRKENEIRQKRRQPLIGSNEELIQSIVDKAVAEWKREYADIIDQTLHPTETAALQAALDALNLVKKNNA